MRGLYEPFNQHTCLDCIWSTQGPSNGPLYCRRHVGVLFEDGRVCIWWERDSEASYTDVEKVEAHD